MIEKLMIEKLTEEQEALLPVYRDKWLKVGLSTEKCDRAKAEKWVADAYKVAGFDPPRLISWAKGPLDLVGEYEKLTGDTFSPSLVVHGSQEASWLSLTDYYLNVLKKEECSPAIPLMEIAKDCGWWIPLEEVAILSEKPVFLGFNEQKQLHSSERAAIEYLDGLKVFALYGITFEEADWKMIISESPDVVKILAFENIEQRMAALKYVGIEKVFANIDSELLDTSSITGNELYVVKNVFSVPRYFLKYSCPSTARVYMSAVPDEVGEKKDADAAMAWKHHTEKKDFLNIFNKGMMT